MKQTAYLVTVPGGKSTVYTGTSHETRDGVLIIHGIVPSEVIRDGVFRKRDLQTYAHVRVVSIAPGQWLACERK